MAKADQKIVILNALTAEEDIFCRAFVQTRNAQLAFTKAFPQWKDPRIIRLDSAALMKKPIISQRISDLSEAMDAPYVFTIGEHLVKLAEIRDAALALSPKVALEAEITRGRLMGFYKDHVMDSNESPGGTTNNLNITFTDEQRAGAVLELIQKSAKAITNES